MKKKNDHKKNEKVKIMHPSRDRNDKQNMDYLVMSSQQISKVRSINAKKLEGLSLRVNDPGDPQNIKSDQIIKQLEEIQKQAKNYDFVDLEKDIVFVLGKRLLYLQIQNRKQQIEKKKCKKQEIQQSFFRHKKIRKFDYQNLIKQKLKQNSYIAKPYSTGKGFVESQISYRECEQVHLQRLQECEFLRIIKEVNKIYMNNYSHYSAQSQKSFENCPALNFVIFLFFIVLSLGVTLLCSNQIPYVEYVLIGNLILIMVILCILGIKSFINKPNHYNQLEQTKYDVVHYFEKINQKNKKLGKKIEWICPDNFMYLQVRFHE